MTEDKRFTRRNALKHIGGSSFAFPFASNVVEGDDTVEIITVKKDGEAKERKKVPIEWHEHVNHAKKVREKVGPKFAKKAGVHTVGIGKSKREYGGKPGHQINIRVDPDTFTSQVPPQKDQIPIETIRAYPSELAHCFNQNVLPDLTGGANVKGSGRATSGYPVYNDDLQSRMLTANHLWEACKDNSNKKLYHDGKKFGEV